MRTMVTFTIHTNQRAQDIGLQATYERKFPVEYATAKQLMDWTVNTSREFLNVGVADLGADGVLKTVSPFLIDYIAASESSILIADANQAPAPSLVKV